MTWSDDPWEMNRFPSANDSERLLAGRLDDDDLPEEAARLAQLLSTMRKPVAAAPLAEEAVITSIAAGIRRAGALGTTPLRSRGARRRVTAKAAAFGLAAALATGTAAAAANGSLPGPVQRAVSATLSHVSISVPHPDEHAGSNSSGAKPENGREGTTPPAGAQGPDATGSARAGLCTAAAQEPPATSNGRRDSSVALSNLQQAADDAGLTVAQFCAGVTPHPARGTPAATAPVGNGASTTSTLPHGPPASTPSGGTNPTPRSQPTPTSHPTATSHTTPTTPATGERGTPGSAHAQSDANARS